MLSLYVSRHVRLLVSSVRAVWAGEGLFSSVYSIMPNEITLGNECSWADCAGEYLKVCALHAATSRDVSRCGDDTLEIDEVGVVGRVLAARRDKARRAGHYPVLAPPRRFGSGSRRPVGRRGAA